MPRARASLTLLAAGALTLGACERPAPEQDATPAPPAEATSDSTAPDTQTAEPPVEVIHQGGEPPADPAPVDPSERDPDPDALDPDRLEEGAGASPLSAIPGFTPGELPTREPKPLDAADVPPDAPVMLQVTVIDLSPASEAALESLAAFLDTDAAASLDEQEVEAFFELAGALAEAGDIEVLAKPRVVISGGERGSLRMEQVPLPASSVPGVPGARNTLLLQLAPAIGEVVGQGEHAVRLIRVGYDFAFTQADTTLEVVAEDLALPIGPRARAAGAREVPSGQTFYVVRKVVGADEQRELLVLVRPQVMQVELNK